MKTLSPLVFFTCLIVLFTQSLGAQNMNYKNLINSYYTTTTNSIIVINIWNTEKPDEIHKLNKLAEKYRNEEILFLAVTDEGKEKVAMFLQEIDFQYEQLSGTEGEKVFNQFQKGMYKEFPIHVIIDQEGEISYKKKNSIKRIEQKMTKKIDALLENSVHNSLGKSNHEFTYNKSEN